MALPFHLRPKANKLFWYLTVEAHDKETGFNSIYADVLKRFEK